MWWLDETATAGSEHLDPDYVVRYEAKAGYDPSADIDALRTLGLGPESIVVDLAAGTGVFAAAVVPLCARVIAVDISPAMTAALRAKREALGLENLTVVEAGYLSYVHDGPPADVVFCRNALHQVPDFWKGVALQRIHDLLRPGGLFRVHDLIYDFEPAEADERGRSLAGRRGGEPGPRIHGLRAGVPRADRAQHLHLALRGVAGADRVLDSGPIDQAVRLCHLHLSARPRARPWSRAAPARPARAR